MDIDYISAYGPGHPVLDAAEVAVIKRVFGRQAYAIPISSIKGVTGNPLAAAGPFQIVSCALSFRHQIVPPTANYQTPDPECDLDFVPNLAQTDEGGSIDGERSRAWWQRQRNGVGASRFNLSKV